MSYAVEALTRYQPRPVDASAELFAERIAHCHFCPFRRAHTCTASRPEQLCTIHARAAHGWCPVGFWGRPPADRPIPARLTRGPVQGDRLGPRPAAEPLASCWPALAREQLVRNLVCHIYPLTAGGHWRKTIERLTAGKRAAQFNGRRLVSIVTGDHCDTPAAVRDAFAAAGFDAEFFDFHNDPDLGEVRTFVPALEKLASTNPHEITCYLQSKGATWPDPQVPAHEWGDVMAAAALDHPDLVAELLDTAPICGSFRHHQPCGQSRGSWHYSGTFFWFRHDVLFSPTRRASWRAIDQNWTGTEAWPALQFSLDESACLFFDDVGAGGKALYDADYWQSTIRPAWQRWRGQRGDRHE